MLGMPFKKINKTELTHIFCRNIQRRLLRRLTAFLSHLCTKYLHAVPLEVATHFYLFTDFHIMRVVLIRDF